jgi:hypothetical protein
MQDMGKAKLAGALAQRLLQLISKWHFVTQSMR